MHLGGWRNRSVNIFHKEQFTFWKCSVHGVGKVAVSLPTHKGDLFVAAVLLGLVTKSHCILRRDKISCTTAFWTSLAHPWVPPHDSQRQNKSLSLSHETNSGIKIPETNCISVPVNSLFLLINLLYLKAELEFLSYQKNPQPKTKEKEPLRSSQLLSLLWGPQKRSLACIAVLLFQEAMLLGLHIFRHDQQQNLVLQKKTK